MSTVQYFITPHYYCTNASRIKGFGENRRSSAHTKIQKPSMWGLQGGGGEEQTGETQSRRIKWSEVIKQPRQWRSEDSQRPVIRLPPGFSMPPHPLPHQPIRVIRGSFPVAERLNAQFPSCWVSSCWTCFSISMESEIVMKQLAKAMRITNHLITHAVCPYHIYVIWNWIYENVSLYSHEQHMFLWSLV